MTIALETELQNAKSRIRELEALVAELSEQVFEDDKTGLPNHRAFENRLEQLMAESRRGRGSFCLVMVDLDHFKKVNDTHGHDIGDQVLREVASHLREGAREIDFVGRFGGEEFCLLLPGADLAGGLKVAERVRSLLESSRCAGLSVTASFGVCAHTPGMSAAVLMKRADKALYKAKAEGRNCVVGA